VVGHPDLVIELNGANTALVIALYSIQSLHPDINGKHITNVGWELDPMLTALRTHQSKWNVNGAVEICY
tara:strand:- start:1070 stop:1276 length:207 start_codon:yes stop_codon:yes gene_type:complete